MVQGLLGDRYFLSALAAVARASSVTGSAPGGSRVDNTLVTPDDDIVRAGVVAGQFYSAVEPAAATRPTTPGRPRSRGAATRAAETQGPRWATGVTDTRIPHVSKTAEAERKEDTDLLPLYGCSGSGLDASGPELWVSLLEKAYAKFWCNRRWRAPRGTAPDDPEAQQQEAASAGYHSIHRGGTLQSALVDLTGGSVEVCMLRSPKVTAALRAERGGGKERGKGAAKDAVPRQQAEKKMLWPIVQDGVHRGHILVASCGGPDGLPQGVPPMAGTPMSSNETPFRTGEVVEPLASPSGLVSDPEQGIAVDSATGLLLFHPYPILWAGEPRKGLRLVKLGDPWTRQEEFLGAGWNGDWSSESELWAEHPEVETALNAIAAAGEPVAAVKRSSLAEFWMSWEDLVSRMSSITVCRLPDVGAAPRAHLGEGAMNGLARGHGVGRGRGVAFDVGSVRSIEDVADISARVATAAIDVTAEDASAVAHAATIASRLGLPGPPSARPSAAVTLAMDLAGAKASSMTEAPQASITDRVAHGWNQSVAIGSGDGGDTVFAVIGQLSGRVGAPNDTGGDSAPCISFSKRVPLPFNLFSSPKLASTAPSAAIGCACLGAKLPITTSELSMAKAIAMATEWTTDVAGGGKCPVPAMWVRPDGDPKFFLAPQFRLVGPKGPAPGQAPPPPTDVLVSVTQLDPRCRKRIKVTLAGSEGGDDGLVGEASGAGSPNPLRRTASALESGGDDDDGSRAKASVMVTNGNVPVEFVVLRRPRGQADRAWEVAGSEVVATSKDSLFAVPEDSPTGHPVPREVVLPSLRLEHDSCYILAVSLAPKPVVPVSAGAILGWDSVSPTGTMPGVTPAAGKTGGDLPVGVAITRSPTSPMGGRELTSDGGTSSGPALSPLFSELDPDEILPFSVRVMAPFNRDVSLEAVGEPVRTSARGRWNAASGTACGPPLLPNGKANGSWGMGPQLFLRVDVNALKQQDRVNALMQSRSGTRKTLAEADLLAESVIEAPPSAITALARAGAKLSLKIVLRRTDRGAGRDDEVGAGEGGNTLANRVGLVVTRAARDTLGGAVADDGDLGTTGGLHSSQASAMTRTASLLEATAVVGDATPPATHFCRKKGVMPGEWVRSTDWRSPHVATMTLRVPASWLVGGNALCLHPMLRTPKAEGSWTCEVYSNVALALDELVESTSARVEDRWHKRSAGGCRLQSEWLRNPAYVLRPDPAILEQAGSEHSYSVVLERPDGPWARAVRKDPVATMVGLYAIAVPKGIDDLSRVAVRKPREASEGDEGEAVTSSSAVVPGVLLAETVFTPSPRVELPLNVQWHGLVDAGLELVIVCATYGPGQEGPLRVEVASPTDLSPHLIPYRDAVHVPSEEGAAT
jgi:hypothetical protein